MFSVTKYLSDTGLTCHIDYYQQRKVSGVTKAQHHYDSSNHLDVVCTTNNLFVCLEVLRAQQISHSHQPPTPVCWTSACARASRIWYKQNFLRAKLHGPLSSVLIGFSWTSRQIKTLVV